MQISKSYAFRNASSAATPAGTQSRTLPRSLYEYSSESDNAYAQTYIAAF